MAAPGGLCDDWDAGCMPRRAESWDPTWVNSRVLSVTADCTCSLASASKLSSAMMETSRFQCGVLWGGDGDGRDPGGDVRQRNEVISAVPGIVDDGRIQDRYLL